ncbi:MAG: energy transducer TonB [Georgfuchsia sp.]
METVTGYPAAFKNTGRQLIGIVLVVILHVLMIYGLINVLAKNTVEFHQLPLQISLIREDKVSPKRELPPPKKLVTKVPKVNPPQLSLPDTITPSPLAITIDRGDVSGEGSEGYGEGLQGEGQLRTAQIDIKRPCPRPEYPAGARPEEQQGTVVLKLLVSADGNVIDSLIESSSGFPQLDEAARLALSHCLYKPAASDGHPEKSWVNFKFRWRLE